MTIDLKPRKPFPSAFGRIANCILGQKGRNIDCPELPLLEGKRALVTGGLAGVGEFITRGLLERGAEVVTMSRGESQGTDAIPGIKSLNVDLADPATIVAAVDELGGTVFDLAFCNAGVVCPKEEQTVTGVEKTFGINVLGHHILYRLLIERGMLSHNAGIIITSGEIYASVKECSAEIPFDSGRKAYSRSKLGNIWQVAELTRRFSNLHTVAVHPGVVASGFGGGNRDYLAGIRNKILISEKQGAQASLIGATQDLPRGCYWHNILGVVDLQADDPARDAGKAHQLWNQLEYLTTPYLR